MKSERFEKLTKFFSDKTKGKINEHNIKYVYGGFAVVVMIIIVLIVLGCKSCSPKKTEGVMQGTVESTATVASQETANEVEVVALEENAHVDINSMIANYFAAVAAGDLDTIRTIEKPLSEMKELTIAARSEYIEDFENIIVYTKPGPTEDSYITFVYNEIRFVNVETAAAAIYTFYVKKAEEGGYYIYNSEINETEEAYINAVFEQQDVVDLFERVNIKFQEAIDSDEALAKMLSELPEQLNESIGTAVAELNASQQETELVEEEQPVETEIVEKEVDFETVRATDTVNVRVSPEENAEKLGKLEKDKTVKRLESLESGWSHVIFEDKEGYIKSEYLAISSVTYKDGSVENLSGFCSPTTTINVRASASENADKVGVAFAGEQLVLLEIMENGWTKIQYEGKDAYVKTEYLQQ